MAEEKKEDNKGALSAMSIGVLVLFLVVVGGLYWWVSKKGKGQVVFPSGLNYTGEEPTAAPQAKRPTYDYAKLAASAEWVDFVSPKEQYTFKYPTGMVPLIFPGDVNDTVTFDVADVPAQFNLMILVETISNYDAKYKGKQADFVKNYYTFFDGLKGVEEVETYKTDKGLSGWRVKYVNKDDVVGVNNYFFVIPGQPDKIIHVNNVFPEEGQAVFTRLLNSLDNFKK